MSVETLSFSTGPVLSWISTFPLKTDKSICPSSKVVGGKEFILSEIHQIEMLLASALTEACKHYRLTFH